MSSLKTPRSPYLSLLSALILMMLVIQSVSLATAQDGLSPNRYENQELGIAFDLPSSWMVTVENQRLSAGLESDLTRIESGLLPQNLVMLVRLGTYSSLGVSNVSELSDRVKQLVLPGVVAPEPVEVNYGGSSGYQTEFTVNESGLTTRVMLLLSTDGRIGIVRGIAPQQLWNTEASAQLNEIMQSMRFTLTSSITTPLDSIPDGDGGVVWHYQLGQNQPERPITLGGITLDQTGVVYVAAGARGFLSLDQTTGSYINFVGPIFADDNLTDVALSPDARLYFANATTNTGRHIMVIDRAGNLQETWGEAGDEPGQFAPGMPRTIAVSKSGDVWTISEGHTTAPTNRLYRFSQSGTLLATVDLDTIKAGFHDVHLDIDVAADRIYLVGAEGGISVVSWNAEIIASGIAQEYLDEAVPTDISVGVAGTFVIATRNQGFVLMNNAGVLLDRFGYAYDTERGGAFLTAEYNQPSGVTVDSTGKVYFAETNPDTGFAQVQVLTFTGEGNLLIVQRVPSVTDVETGPITYSTGGEIAYGSTTYGILTNRSNRHEYTFRANAGDKVSIILQDVSPAQRLDPMLILFDGNYNLLRDSDDVGANDLDLQERDSAIQFEFNRSGTYIIRVTRFGGEGQYQLRLSLMEE